MKCKLNYELGKPTLNGRIYNKDNFIEKLDDIIDKGLLLYTDITGGTKPNFFKIMGQVKSYIINNYNEIEFDIKMIEIYEGIKIDLVSTFILGEYVDDINVSVNTIFYLYPDFDKSAKLFDKGE